MKSPVFAQAILAAALALLPIVSHADETISGNLTVKRDLLVHQTIEVGQATLGSIEYPAYTLQANSALGSTSIDQMTYGSISTWNWFADGGSGAKQLLKLESTGKLSLYNPTNPTTPIIVLDAGGEVPELTIAGKKVVTEANIETILRGNTNGTIDSIAMGGGIVLANISTAVGHGAWVSGTRSSAFGYRAEVTGDYSLAMGAQVYADGESSFAIGYQTTAYSNSSLALGSMTNAKGVYSSAVGSGASAMGDYSTALGFGANTKGDWSVAVGPSAVAKSIGTSAFGSSAQATGICSIAIGDQSAASGDSALAVGRQARARGDYSIAEGAWADAESVYSVALGFGTYTTQSYQVALGSHNQPIDDAFLMLGNGWDWANRSNLFVIMKDGRGIFRNIGYVEPTVENPKPIQPVALTVEGSTEIKGTLRVRPAGDLPMGIFTAGGQP